MQKAKISEHRETPWAHQSVVAATAPLHVTEPLTNVSALPPINDGSLTQNTARFFKTSHGSLQNVFRKCFRFVGVSCLSSVCGLMDLSQLTLLVPDRFILADTNQMVALLIDSLSELYCSWMKSEGSVLCIR